MGEPLLAQNTTAPCGGIAVLNLDELTTIAHPSHPNALLIGGPSIVGDMITTLLPLLPRPVIQCDSDISEALRSVERGTLVIWNVDRLRSGPQGELLDFLTDRHGAVQVIATAHDDLFRCVRRGEFLPAFYYRLNTVLVRADVDWREGSRAI
jgi:hypothetical protein